VGIDPARTSHERCRENEDDIGNGVDRPNSSGEPVLRAMRPSAKSAAAAASAIGPSSAGRRLPEAYTTSQGPPGKIATRSTG
jgi:hypothetical protein